MEANQAEQFLIDEIRRGSESAWRQLIDRYYGRLRAFARSRVAGHADAEDLVQETFVGFLQSLGSFDPSRSLETYLFTILRYKVYDLLRRRTSGPHEVLAADERWWDDVLPVDGETPSRVAEVAENQRLLETILTDVLRKLINEYRDRGAFGDLQVIELIFYGRKRNVEIGELFEVDQKSVAGIKFRAIGKLQKFIAEMKEARLPDLDERQLDTTVSAVWRERRLTCLKRGTLGSYLLDVLDEPWKSYVQFHLDVVGCPLCLANLQDIEQEHAQGRDPALMSQAFATSVGFLSRLSVSPGA